VLAAAMLLLLLLAAALRWWVIATLGERWTTRVVWVPGRRLATDGPFRYLRHPNYVAVATEIVALPLVHTAWLTALVFSLGNALLLRHRIAVEESVLRSAAGESGGEPG
jgi:methyltransferase